MTSEPRRTPPRWLNRLMRLMLRTPGLQRLVGRSTALLTFVGRKSGKSYTTPISYSQRGERVILTCHESRQWWRNVRSNPRVRLRLAGKERTGIACVADEESAPAMFAEFLTDQRMIARALAISFENGAPRAEQVAAALEDTVVVAVGLDP
ncbi:MAG: nitroreductase family deazaflavin-dependent oxidoreductase [Acidimicrobiia bacterium]|nr:nitroreductase family deazaflavin-dependent oxidoreductase [Acidimicrobiia bacterium]